MGCTDEPANPIDYTTINNAGTTPLMLAVASRNEQRAQEAITQLGDEASEALKFQDTNGNTIIHLAIMSECHDFFILMLIKMEAPLHVPNVDGDIPLLLAIRHGRHNSATLIFDHAYKNQIFQAIYQPQLRSTPLHHAVVFKRFLLLKTFLDKKLENGLYLFDINYAHGTYEETPLITALLTRTYEAVSILMQRPDILPETHNYRNLTIDDILIRDPMMNPFQRERLLAIIRREIVI